MLQVARKIGQFAASIVPIARLALLALVVSFVWSAAASAQTREFVGKLDSVSEKKVIVDNRKGDKISFVKVDETVVEGEKAKWEDLKKNDWVNVHWQMKDNPRKAYKVVVMPPKEEGGEDVQ